MTFLWGALTGLMLGGTLGWWACVKLGTLGTYADEYARGWYLGYHAGKNAREE